VFYLLHPCPSSQEEGKRLHFSLFTFHFSLFTLHSSLFTFHFSLFTLHSSLFTLHFSLFTLHFLITLPGMSASNRPVATAAISSITAVLNQSVFTGVEPTIFRLL